jgi:nucleoside-diphosphate-sugar epimerase
LARVLIIGCGCRGQSLARELVVRGYAVRGTTRDPVRVAEIEAAGAEAFVGDPDRIVTLAAALDQVSIVCVLLGSATGAPDRVAPLHGPRLEMLLSRMLDTAIRGVVYEASGTVAPQLLRTGAELVRTICERSRIPYALIDTDPALREQWFERLLGAGS